MRETLYSPPDGEGPTIVREKRCNGCRHYKEHGPHWFYCRHSSVHASNVQPTLLRIDSETPSWCPIVSADPEGWERRLKGEGDG